VLSLVTTGAALFVSVFFAKDITLFVCKYVNIQIFCTLWYYHLDWATVFS
jgi:hypothetical protein